MLILGHTVGHISLWQSAAAPCSISMFIVSSGAYPARPVCDAQATTRVPVFTTSDIASPSGRFSTGIATGSMLSSGSRCFPPTSAIPACATLIGIFQRVHS